MAFQHLAMSPDGHQLPKRFRNREAKDLTIRAISLSLEKAQDDDTRQTLRNKLAKARTILVKP